MSKEQELLLKDLCARLPYGVKCQVQEDEYTYIGTLCRIEVDNKNGHLLDFAESISGLDCQVYLSEIKPYLLPLSSMTEEQRKEYDSIIYHNVELHADRYYEVIDVDSFELLHDFYHKNHLDYRGLIPLGLAINCTNLKIY